MDSPSPNAKVPVLARLVSFVICPVLIDLVGLPGTVPLPSLVVLVTIRWVVVVVLVLFGRPLLLAVPCLSSRVLRFLRLSCAAILADSAGVKSCSRALSGLSRNPVDSAPLFE